jgi:hypothetical protein
MEQLSQFILLELRERRGNLVINFEKELYDDEEHGWKGCERSEKVRNKQTPQ